MISKIFIFLFLAIPFWNCSKEKIDVSTIYLTDSQGNVNGNFQDDGQWIQKSFSKAEMDLFNDLDTANLAGTSTPLISQHSYAFPNPFVYQTNVSASLSQPLNGYIVVKYIVVNGDMKPVHKAALLINVSSSISFLVAGNFNSGKYRLYFSYSSQGNDHFFKSWGNIQKN